MDERLAPRFRVEHEGVVHRATRSLPYHDEYWLICRGSSNKSVWCDPDTEDARTRLRRDDTPVTCFGCLGG